MSFKQKKFLLIVPLLSCFAFAHSKADAKTKVVTTTPDLAWAARTIGGDLVEVKSLLSGREDPHYVDAVPEFIRLVADADVVCQVGLGLEIGWLPKVLEKSGQAKVQPGGTGFCDLGKKAKVIEVPTGSVDRSMGDTHPHGNPHYWLGPETFWHAAKEILEVLTAVDSANAQVYLRNYNDEKSKILNLKETIGKQLTSFSQTRTPLFIQYHREFSYFFQEFNLNSLGAIEEKPGVMPSAGRIASISMKAKSSGVRLALVKPNDPRGTVNKFSELSSVSVITFNPSLVTGENEDYHQHLKNLALSIRNQLTRKDQN